MYQTHDNVVSSLQAILIYYGIHADIGGLIGAYSATAVDIKTIQKVSEQIGLELIPVDIKFSDISKISHPVFFPVKEDSYAVAFPQSSYMSKLVSGKETSDQQAYGRIAPTDTISGYAVRPHDSASHQEKHQPFSWFWLPIKENRREYAEIAVASVFINLLALAIPLYSMNIYDRVVPNFSQSTLIVLTVGIIIAIALDFILKIARAFIIESISSRLSIHYDKELMERLNLIPNWKIQMSAGEKAHLFHELQNVRDYYAGKLFPALIDAPFLIVYLTAVFIICPMLTLVPVIFGILIIGVSMLSWKSYGSISKQAFAAGQKFSSGLYEMLDGVTAARLSNAMGVRLHRWGVSLQDSVKIRRKISFLNNLVQTGASSLVFMSQVCVLFFGIYQIHVGHTTVGGLVAISIIASRALMPVVNIGSVFSQYKRSQVFLESLNKIFSMPHDGEKAGRLAAKGPFKGQIELRNVTFLYPRSALAAISDVSLLIQEKEKIGLIGQNGAGKSTLAQLLSGMLDPQQGNIFIDHYLYGTVSPMELHRIIGYVPQAPFLFSGSIKDNILMGNTDFSRRSLDEAVHVAGLEKMIMESGFGLETEIGDNGGYLSAGQRQALSLARALIHHPRVLVLDEPTSGMDHALEQHLLRSLKHYLDDKTFVMVTHRTPLLPLVDRLILMDKGRIKADGTVQNMLKALEGGAANG